MNKLHLIRKTVRLTCTWVPTGDAKRPLACVWAPSKAPRAGNTQSSERETSKIGGRMHLCA
jgi:hypothetical protein